MTARRRLLPVSEVREMLDLLKSYGINPAERCIDILADGVRVYPPAGESAATGGGNAYDQWKRLQQD